MTAVIRFAAARTFVRSAAAVAGQTGAVQVARSADERRLDRCQPRRLPCGLRHRVVREHQSTAVDQPEEDQQEDRQRQRELDEALATAASPGPSHWITAVADALSVVLGTIGKRNG